MNMPRFTAEASLYRTNGHYRTGRNRHAVHLPARMNGTIHTAVTIIEWGEEVIEIEGQAPQAPWNPWVGGGGVTGPLGGPSGAGGGGEGGGGGPA